MTAGTGLAEPETASTPAASAEAPVTLSLVGRTVALDAGHEPPFASTDCGRCRWMGSGRSSHFFGIRLSYPDNPLALTAGPYAGALAEYELNQDLVRRVALVLRQAGADVVLTRIGRSDGNFSAATDGFSAATDGVSTATTDSLVGRRILQRALSATALAELVLAVTTPDNDRAIDAVYNDSSRGRSAILSLENVLARGERANRARADVALVFHADAVNDPQLRGRLLFVYHPGEARVHDRSYLSPPDGPSLQLAEKIEASLREVSGGIPLTGLFGRDLWYLGTARMPAVLIEVGRLTNRLDADWLSVAANRQATAIAIAEGIGRFLSTAAP